MNEDSHQLDANRLESYKLAVDMADRISARRSTSNSFFLTVQTAFVAVIGLTSPSLDKRPWWIIVVVSLAGIVLSVSWWLQLRSYRDLNRAKFRVINDIEGQLPIKIFSDEWKYLKEDPIPGWRGRYAELGSVERIVPWVFAAIYALLAIGIIFK